MARYIRRQRFDFVAALLSAAVSISALSPSAAAAALDSPASAVSGFNATVPRPERGTTCSSSEDCVDDNECTVDRCAKGTCISTNATGYAGIHCELDRMVDPNLCGGEAIHPKLAKLIAKKSAKARKLAQKAAEASTKAEKLSKLVKKANKSLNVILKKAAKLAKGNQISDDCHTSVAQRVQMIQKLILYLE